MPSGRPDHFLRARRRQAQPGGSASLACLSRGTERTLLQLYDDRCWASKG